MDAAIDRPGDRFIGIEMGRHIEPGVLGLLDGRADLVARKAQRMDRIVGRGDAAVRHHLDETRAGLDLLARRAAHAVDPIGEPAKRADACGKAHLPIVRSRPEVAVAAGLAQGLAGDDEARTLDQPFIDRPHEAVVGASGVAHGREPAHQQLSQDARRAHRRERRRRHRIGGEIDQRRHHMHVAVDQSRHQGLAGKIDPRRARRPDRLI